MNKLLFLLVCFWEFLPVLQKSFSPNFCKLVVERMFGQLKSRIIVQLNLTANAHCEPCIHIFMHEPGFLITMEFAFFDASQSVPLLCATSSLLIITCTLLLLLPFTCSWEWWLCGSCPIWSDFWYHVNEWIIGLYKHQHTSRPCFGRRPWIHRTSINSIEPWCCHNRLTSIYHNCYCRWWK